LFALESNGPLHTRLGRNGNEYFDHHYAWPVIEGKYLEMFDRLARDPAAAARPFEPLPNWFARRRRDIPPAVETLARIPSGPIVAPAGDRHQLSRSA
jgi:hypothetical protein